MSQTSKILSWIVIFSFILGLILMALAEHVFEGAFLTGLGLFILGLVISITWAIWNTSGWMERQTRKYFD